jgi:hypothetical protein
MMIFSIMPVIIFVVPRVVFDFMISLIGFYTLKLLGWYWYAFNEQRQSFRVGILRCFDGFSGLCKRWHMINIIIRLPYVPFRDIREWTLSRYIATLLTIFLICLLFLYLFCSVLGNNAWSIIYACVNWYVTLFLHRDPLFLSNALKLAANLVDNCHGQLIVMKNRSDIFLQIDFFSQRFNFLNIFSWECMLQTWSKYCLKSNFSDN